MTAHSIKRRLDSLETLRPQRQVDFGAVPHAELERAMSILAKYGAIETGDAVSRCQADLLPWASRAVMDAEICDQCPAIVKALAEQRG